MGHRALKNLLAAEREGKDIKELLPELGKDLDRLTEAVDAGKDLNMEELHHLERKHIRPGMLKQMGKLNEDEAFIMRKVRNRVSMIVGELEPIANAVLDGEHRSDAIGLSRSDKNRQVMRCYRYWDWQYNDTDGYKFLRKDEYQRMSVFHYSLGSMDRNNGGNKLERDRKFGFLIKDIVGHIPDEIKKMIRHSRHLDELLQKVAKATISKLKGWEVEMETVDEEQRGVRLHRLGLGQGMPKPWRRNRHVPFDIHPGLIPRVFYGKDGLKGVSLSARIRKNGSLTDGLVAEHYTYAPYLEECLDAAKMRREKQIRRKVVGKMDELHTKDTLLWAAAKDYLAAIRPEIAGLVQDHLMRREGGGLRVANMRDVEVPMELDTAAHGKVVVRLKMHQLDDYLIVESKPQIGKAVDQVLRRFATDAERTAIGISTDDRGSTHVPYEEVFKEIQRVYNRSVHWARVLMEWELGVIKDWGANDPKGRSNTGKEKEKAGKMAHLSFGDIIARSGQTGDVGRRLRETRNAAFHAEIPVGWSYREREDDAALCDLLGYEKREKRNYEVKKE